VLFPCTHCPLASIQQILARALVVAGPCAQMCGHIAGGTPKAQHHAEAGSRPFENRRMLAAPESPARGVNPHKPQAACMRGFPRPCFGPRLRSPPFMHAQASVACMRLPRLPAPARLCAPGRARRRMTGHLEGSCAVGTRQCIMFVLVHDLMQLLVASALESRQEHGGLAQACP